MTPALAPWFCVSLAWVGNRGELVCFTISKTKVKIAWMFGRILKETAGSNVSESKRERGTRAGERKRNKPCALDYELLIEV